MKNTLTKLGPSKFQIDVEVGEKAWKEAQEKAARKLASKVSIPGFRPGKAPEAMLRARIDPNKVLDNALQDVLNPAYNQALNEFKIRPYHNPDIEVVSVSDKDITLRFVVVAMPSVTLGAYTGLTAERKTVSVTDEEVNESIAKLLEDNASLVLVEDEAKMGDTVVIDFKGFIDGVAFEGGEANNYALELGSNSFVPGFEDALVGIKAEESRDVKVTFPTQYVAELAGKEATFACVCHEVKRKSVPVLSDEAVADLDIKDVKTIDELKAHQKEELLKKKTEEAEREHYQALLDQIVAGSEVEIADEILDNEAAREEENLKKNIESNGLTFQQYLDVLGKTAEELKAETREKVAQNLKGYLVTLEICAKEKLLVSDAELDFELAKLAESYHMTLEQVKAAYGGNLESFRESMRQKKLQDFILANNK